MPRDNNPSSYRCSICAINWRPISFNEVCSQCGEKTSPFYKQHPDPDEELVEIGGLASVGQFEPRELTLQEEGEVIAFRNWLNTVGPDDFRASIQYPPDHPYHRK